VEYYNYSLDLPHTKIKLHHRELNTKEQIALAKANLTIANTKESLIDYHNFILSVLKNCVGNFNDIENITIIEYVLFLVKLRILSVGNVIEFLMKDSERKTKIQLDLKSYLTNLYRASSFFENEENSIIIENNIIIKINWPIVKSINVFNEFLINDKNIYESINDSIQEFIEYIKIDNKKIQFNSFNSKQKNDLLDSLPMHLKLISQNKIFNALKELITSEIFNVSIFKEQRFNIYNLSFMEHIKMFFSYDVKSIYSEIYFLASCNINPEYTDNLSPSERKVYISIIQEQRSKRDGSNDQNSNAIRDLALEFGEQVP
jgi:hypothetical protein